MNTQTFGQLAALGTAFCWAITSLSFESAGKRVGSLQVNLIRLIVAFAIFTVYGSIVHHRFLPFDAGAHVWTWLTLSGLVGFVFGDLFLFQAFVDVGARKAMLIYSSVPPMTAVLGWVILGETLSPSQLFGMVTTVSGIVMVVTTRKRLAAPDIAAPAATLEKKRLVEHPLRGVWFAVLGALGQALGLVLSRHGAPDFDPFGATQIRSLAGMAGFIILFAVTHRWKRVAVAFRDGKAMKSITRGAFFGPFLGVSLGLFAAQRAGTGVASTLIATVPVILIPISVFVKKEAITLQEIAGAVVAVAGVAILFIG